MENAKKNLVFHFGGGRHAYCPQKPVVDLFYIILSGEDVRTAKKVEAQYESEKVETGKVATAVYIYYVKSMGWLLFGCCVTAFTSYQIFATGSSVWLKIWTDSAENLNATDTVC